MSLQQPSLCVTKVGCMLVPHMHVFPYTILSLCVSSDFTLCSSFDVVVASTLCNILSVCSSSAFILCSNADMVVTSLSFSSMASSFLMTTWSIALSCLCCVTVGENAGVFLLSCPEPLLNTCG